MYDLDEMIRVTENSFKFVDNNFRGMRKIFSEIRKFMDPILQSVHINDKYSLKPQS